MLRNGLRGEMACKFVAVTTLLLLLTACRQEQLSLPIAHAAMETRPLTRPAPALIDTPPPTESCYSYILMRPKNQRATAVQARLKKADQLTAAFHPQKVSVDLQGDHANILSLQFPVMWPAQAAYSDRISTVVEDYLSSPDVQDYLCNSGFAEVRLSARGLNDRQIHPMWTAHLTSEGLVKDVPVRH